LDPYKILEEGMLYQLLILLAILIPIIKAQQGYWGIYGEFFYINIRLRKRIKKLHIGLHNNESTTKRFVVELDNTPT
jgi:hypothetical protein